MDLLQGAEDSECREGYHGQEAVAQNTGHTSERHCQGTHQTQQNVHPSAGCGTGAIHITKVSFTCLERENKQRLVNLSLLSRRRFLVMHQHHVCNTPSLK